MKAIILARVSSKEQEDNNSIPAQTRRLHEYTDRFGLDVIEVCQLVESSTKANRVKFTEIITSIKRSKEVVALVTDTIDRLQRDFKESVVLNELRLQGKIELHFMREGLIVNQLSNSSEILRWDMGVMFAKSYVTQLSDNVKRSLEQKKQNGEWLGKAPFGYKNVDLPDGKKWIEPDPDSDYIVQDMFKWYTSESYSMRGIRERLVEEHGLHKSMSQVNKILKNSFYYGVMQMKGAAHAHSYAPLIGKDLYDLAQRRAFRFQKRAFKYAGLPYFYRGLITCGTCGCSITPEKSKGYVYYHCTQYKGKHRAAYIREEDLTEQFVAALRAIQPTQAQYDEVMAALKASHGDKITYKAVHTARLQSELTRIDERMTKHYNSYLDGDIERDFYKSKNEELKAQRAATDKKLNSIDSANDEFYKNAETIMRLVLNVPRLFESSELEEKRRIINIVLQNLELHDRQLRWKYKKPFDSMASYKNDSSWLGWRDSNPRMHGPKPCALPLGDTPKLHYFTI